MGGSRDLCHGHFTRPRRGRNRAPLGELSQFRASHRTDLRIERFSAEEGKNLRAQSHSREQEAWPRAFRACNALGDTSTSPAGSLRNGWGQDVRIGHQDHRQEGATAGELSPEERNHRFPMNGRYLVTGRANFVPRGSSSSCLPSPHPSTFFNPNGTCFSI